MEKQIRKTDFNYDLPEELIAQEPIKDRSMSRLMVLNKETGEVRHEVFKNIINYLSPGDCLVLNDTIVIPARIYGKKLGTGADIEFVLLKRIRKMSGSSIKARERAKTGPLCFWRWNIKGIFWI